MSGHKSCRHYQGHTRHKPEGEQHDKRLRRIDCPGFAAAPDNESQQIVSITRPASPLALQVVAGLRYSTPAGGQRPIKRRDEWGIRQRDAIDDTIAVTGNDAERVDSTELAVPLIPVGRVVAPHPHRNNRHEHNQ